VGSFTRSRNKLVSYQIVIVYSLVYSKQASKVLISSTDLSWESGGLPFLASPAGPVIYESSMPSMQSFARRSEIGGSQSMGSVLLVGNPSLPLKGFDVAIKALTTVNQFLPISLTWVCQTQPTASSVPALVGSGLVIDLYISPTQVIQLPSYSPQHAVNYSQFLR
jgi:hypothetical protein